MVARRVVLPALLLLVVALAACGSAPAAPPPHAAPGPGFGFALGGETTALRGRVVRREMRAAAAAGGRWVRMDVNWEVIQHRGPHRYDWRGTDRAVRAARARGLRVLAVLLYTPRWARPVGADSRYAPRPSALARFARAAARHYARLGVHDWEVWNEPNLSGFFHPAPDPARYAAMLRASAVAIRAADARATIVSGGLSPSDGTNGDIAPVDFLTALYAAGAGPYFDAVGHHPYCAPVLPGDPQPWSAWNQMAGTDPSLRSVMVANGDEGKRIWATEFGAPTDGPAGDHVAEWFQADMVSTAMRLWRTYPWAGPLFVYELRDVGSARDTRENFYGLVRRDFSAKPALAAFAAAAAAR